jgi:hypothetical protein
MRGLGTAGRNFRVGVNRWSKNECNHLHGNVIAHGSHAGHSRNNLQSSTSFVLSLAGLCPTLRDQLAIQWSFQMGFGHEVWEVTRVGGREATYFAMLVKRDKCS